MKIFGIMITYRRPEAVAEFLCRLAEQQPILDRLVVVDNAGDEAVRHIVSSHVGHPDSIEYLPLRENRGPAGGIATGMARVMEVAGPDDWMVLFDDDDPPWSPTILTTLRDFAVGMVAEEPLTAAVALDGGRWDTQRARLWRPPPHETGKALPVDYLTGDGFPFYRVEAINEVGTPDERLFFGFDDLEIGLRLRRRGYWLFLHERLYRDRHSLGGSVGIGDDPAAKLSRVLPPWRRYYAVRNLLYLARESGGFSTAAKVTILYGIASPILAVLRGERRSGARLRLSLKACFDGWLGRMGSSVKPES